MDQRLSRWEEPFGIGLSFNAVFYRDSLYPSPVPCSTWRARAPYGHFTGLTTGYFSVIFVMEKLCITPVAASSTPACVLCVVYPIVEGVVWVVGESDAELDREFVVLSEGDIQGPSLVALVDGGFGLSGIVGGGAGGVPHLLVEGGISGCFADELADVDGVVDRQLDDPHPLVGFEWSFCRHVCLLS